MNKQKFLDAVLNKKVDRTVFGTPTSIVCQDLMKEVAVTFPEGHTDPEKMFQLALAGYTILGLDNVMPLFSVCHEAAGMGCNVNWDTKSGTSKEMKELAGDHLSLNGGISNYKLLREKPDDIIAQALEAKETGINIIEPEYAIPLQTPLANLKAITSIGRS